MRILLFIFILLFATSAFAYDDQESTRVYVQCLAKQQRLQHMQGDYGLIVLVSACQQQAIDFMRYNCPGYARQCEGLAFSVAHEVQKKVK